MYTIKDFLDKPKRIVISFAGSSLNTVHEVLEMIYREGGTWSKDFNEAQFLRNIHIYDCLVYKYGTRAGLDDGSLSFFKDEGFTIVPCEEFLHSEVQFNQVEFMSTMFGE
jgi:hypothetical protein